MYELPVDEYLFLLRTFGYENEKYDFATVTAILNNLAKFYNKEMAENMHVGEEKSPCFDVDSGDVLMPEHAKSLYKKMIESGYFSLFADEKYGGEGAPITLRSMHVEGCCAADMGFSVGLLLTLSAITCLIKTANDKLKNYYLPKMVKGEWSGVMALTEPHCGTDLGLIKTNAVIYNDHYKLTGNKIWISYGEHDLVDNIVHLVLARLPNAPAGVKGISLFLVPKYLPDGKANTLKCIGLEQKLGIHLSPTCFMRYEAAEAWLIGEKHKGLSCLFVMMNEARVDIGIQGLALSERAYQIAKIFAVERRQSRSLDRKKRDEAYLADKIIVHPDVRRMLLIVKSTNEGMRALVLFTSMIVDAGDQPDLLGILTPIVKSYCSEQGTDNISTCMQVMGGAGYVKDSKIEQIYRDSRIAMIYEGVNSIQAFDLVFRKLPKNHAKATFDLLNEMKKYADKAPEPFQYKLKDSVLKLEKLSRWLLSKIEKDPELVNAVATNYLKCYALVLLTFMWTRMAMTNNPEKLKTGKFFVSYLLPEMDACLLKIYAGNSDIISVDVTYF